MNIENQVTGDRHLSRGNKSLLLNWQEQRGAYWIKKYEEAIMAFEDLTGN